VTYRLAPPGARIANGKLEANSEFPATPIEYRTKGTAWRRYDRPVAVTGPVELRTRTPDGRRASRTVTVSP
jgi:hexosaminidase